MHDGERWLGPDSMDQASVQGYRQTIDMRTATARTAYEWVDGSRRTSILVETFISRASPGLAAVRLELVPQPGRTRAASGSRSRGGRPAPASARHALAHRAGLGPERAVVSRAHGGRIATGAPTDRRRRSLTLAASPEGRKSIFAEAAEVRWPRDLPGAKVQVRASGDTAAVEVAFEAVADVPTSSRSSSASPRPAETGSPRGGRAARRAEEARARGYDALGDRQRRRVGPALGDRHRPRRQSRAPAGQPARCCSTCSAAPTRAPRWAFRRWDSPAAGTTGTSSGTPTPGCFPRWSLTHPDVAHSMVAFRARTLPGRGGQRAGERLPRRPVSVGGRRARRRDDAALRRAERQLRDPRERRRRPRPVAVLPGHRRLRVARPRRVSRCIRGTADFWVSRALVRLRRRPLPHSEGRLGGGGTRRRERRRVHQRGRPAEPGVRDRGRRAGSASRPIRGGPRSPRSSTCRSTRRADSSAPTRARRTRRSGWVTPLLAYPLGRRR